jgi:hypothetical protein
VDLLEVKDLEKYAATGQLLGKLFFLIGFATPPDLVASYLPDLPETSLITLEIGKLLLLVANWRYF